MHDQRDLKDLTQDAVLQAQIAMANWLIAEQWQLLPNTLGHRAGNRKPG